ncbi:PTS system, N-acetylglucosamine-specific IIBC component [Corynebacterium pyruviciproducens ATCC BAA-1742]|uniref:PTS system, N-acetylglucosamine-specific IIBC component n=1 Tax=Corynebacterium pyruviciproducens ATCC BAA-1742 TaxID=1125779 RepID=S2Z343_9CORY|nr:N-acetylglucosamine-specific PTS transporter subunit IIBC [Corynebacterium pyruviciproducens]EPD68635.1 PTS system, N-acetylglucosamine-specific IIBC component [Corynebacterium pyruviciproducens ATCC BAA-1742]
MSTATSPTKEKSQTGNVIMTAFQKLGRALMGAVAIMPVAALLMGIGYWIDPEGWGEGNLLAAVLITAGSAVLNNLGVIFAIAIAFGLAKDHNGAAALSGWLGFTTLISLLDEEAVAGYRGVDLESMSDEAALDWASQGWAAVGPKNVLFGIAVGILAAWVYNRFHATKLPDALAFFAGRRLVPILTSLFSIVLAGIFYFLWPLIYGVLFDFGTWIQGMGAVGAGLYAFANRLLIPTGLHHALNSIFWFDIIGINDIGNFLAGGKTIEAAAAATTAATCPGIWADGACQVVGFVGRYQAGFFPIMMFGLPGAALAMYLRADTKRRKVVGSLMLAAALASFFTGVTEPLEFSFMFLAPLLYVVHAVLTGISVAIAAAFHWTAGFGFSAGFVDMLLSARNPLANNWWMLLVMGVIFFVLYFVIFYFLIGLMDLHTPGRGEDEADDGATLAADAETSDVARQIIVGLGGEDNIDSIDYCTTRLRVQVKDNVKVSESAIKKSGIAGVIRPSQKNVQVVVGPKVQFVYDEVARQMSHTDASLEGEKEVTVELQAPFAGQAATIADVPDPTFSGKMLGDGFAVAPQSTSGSLLVCAPAAGTLQMVFKTGHAFSVKTTEGLDVLVHIGLDTVELKGEGFTVLTQQGEQVTAGQPIIEVDLARLKQKGKNLITPVVLSEKSQVAEVHAITGAVSQGDTVATVTMA